MEDDYYKDTFITVDISSVKWAKTQKIVIVARVLDKPVLRAWRLEPWKIFSEKVNSLNMYILANRELVRRQHNGATKVNIRMNLSIKIGSTLHEYTTRDIEGKTFGISEVTDDYIELSYR